MTRKTMPRKTPPETTPPQNGNLMSTLSPDDRPRERLLRCGGGALSDAELVAVLLRTGRPGLSAIEMGHEILAERGGLQGLLLAAPETLRRRGLGGAKTATLLAAIELGRRLAKGEIPDRQPMGQPEAVANYLMMRYGQEDQEVMGAFYLDVRNRLIAEGEVYRGTLHRTVVEPRAILKEALLRSASALILFHTHPSGDPSPSPEDLTFTRRMATAAKVVGIRLLDHLILGGAGRWVSLKRRGAW